METKLPCKIIGFTALLLDWKAEHDICYNFILLHYDVNEHDLAETSFASNDLCITLYVTGAQFGRHVPFKNGIMLRVLENDSSHFAPLESVNPWLQLMLMVKHEIQILIEQEWQNILDIFVHTSGV